MEQGVWIRDLRDKGKGIRDEEERIKGKTEVEFDTKDQVLLSLLSKAKVKSTPSPRPKTGV